MSKTEESQEGPLGFADYFDEEELQSSQTESKTNTKEYDDTKPFELSEEEKGYCIPTVKYNWFEETADMPSDKTSREYVKRKRAHAQLMCVQNQWKEALETAEELLDLESKTTDEAGFVLTRAEHNEMTEIVSVAKRRLGREETGP